jgi:hypothetical protein
MEFGAYYLVRPGEAKKLAKLASVNKLGKVLDAKSKKERWIPIPVDDAKLPKLVDPRSTSTTTSTRRGTSMSS